MNRGEKERGHTEEQVGAHVDRDEEVDECHCTVLALVLFHRKKQKITITINNIDEGHCTHVDRDEEVRKC